MSKVQEAIVVLDQDDQVVDVVDANERDVRKLLRKNGARGWRAITADIISLKMLEELLEDELGEDEPEDPDADEPE